MRWVRAHWIAIVTGTVLFFVGIGIGAASGSSESATETLTETQVQTRTQVRTQVNTRTVVNTVTAEPAGPSGSIDGDGTFLVGEDIAPGTYRSPPPESGNCYWARLRDLEGGINSIIANSNSSGPSLLRVAASDFAVETTGCETFERIG